MHLVTNRANIIYIVVSIRVSVMPGWTHWKCVVEKGIFQKHFQISRALKISMLYRNPIFQFVGKIFYVEFYWNSTQNILLIQWKMFILFRVEHSKALGFKSLQQMLDNIFLLFLIQSSQNNLYHCCHKRANNPSLLEPMLTYCLTSDISHTLVGNKIMLITQM